MSPTAFWLIVALVLVGAEIFTGGFGILWFAVSALGAAGLAYLGFGLPAQLLAMALGGLILFALSRPLARRLTQGRSVATGARALVGREGVVTQALGDPAHPHGYVRIGGEEFRATATRPFRVGERVLVTGIVGATLQVEQPRRTKEGL